MSGKKILTVVVTGCLLFGLSHITYGQNSPGEYLDSCNSTQPCNAAKHLNCSTENICVCSGNGDLFYNETTQKCTAFVGKPCNEHPNSGYSKPCIANSWCRYQPNVAEGVCQCTTGFMAVFGKCLMGHNFYGCTGASDCNAYANLKCSFGTCICDLNAANVTNQEWNGSDEEGTCLSLVGASCTGGRSCVANAECENNRSCICSSGFQETENRHCLKGVGSDCTSNSDCVSNHCSGNATVAGTCMCPPGQIESPDKRCLVLPGQSCSENNICIEHASCSQGENVCVCDQGFSFPDSGDKCLANFNSSCPMPPTEELCNTDIYLKCNGTGTASRCICEAGYEYNATLERCQGGFDSICKLPSERESDCVYSTVCSQESGEGAKKCGCIQGLVKGQMENVCRAPHGEACNLYGCDNYLRQHCNVTSNSCECESEDLYWVTTQQKCVAKLDKSCRPEDGRPLACGDEAHCDGETNVCICNQGFHPNEFGTECLQGSGSGTLTLSAAVTAAFIMVLIRLF